MCRPESYPPIVGASWRGQPDVRKLFLDLSLFTAGSLLRVDEVGFPACSSPFQIRPSSDVRRSMHSAGRGRVWLVGGWGVVWGSSWAVGGGGGVGGAQTGVHIRLQEHRARAVVRIVLASVPIVT